LKVGLNPGAPQGGSGEQYFLGEFDGTSFKASEEAGAHGWTNYGKDDYCAISFNGIPPGGQPVLLGWMNNWDYASKLQTSPWRGQMSLARKISLVRDQSGIGLAQDPVIDPLRKTAVPLQLEPSSGSNGVAATLSPPYELDFEEVTPNAKSFGVRIYYDDQHWTEVGFDKAKGEFYIDRTRSGETSIPGFAAKTTAPVAPGRPYNGKLIIDRSSVEAFAQNGTIAMTNLVYPPTTSNRIVFFPSGPKTAKVHARLWKLASVWQGADREHGANSR
jgi:fructan beta-fructosidase